MDGPMDGLIEYHYGGRSIHRDTNISYDKSGWKEWEERAFTLSGVISVLNIRSLQAAIRWKAGISRISQSLSTIKKPNPVGA